LLISILYDIFFFCDMPSLLFNFGDGEKSL